MTAAVECAVCGEPVRRSELAGWTHAGPFLRVDVAAHEAAPDPRARLDERELFVPSSDAGEVLLDAILGGPERRRIAELEATVVELVEWLVGPWVTVHETRVDALDAALAPHLGRSSS